MSIRREISKVYGSPSLGLNAVSGAAVGQLGKWLAPKSKVITYGGMSQRPLMIPTSQFIFNDLYYKGFWMTRWNQF